jgi:hypothetical protein
LDQDTACASLGGAALLKFRSYGRTLVSKFSWKQTVTFLAISGTFACSQRAFGTYGYNENFEASDNDSYNIDSGDPTPDNNPFDDPSPRGAPAGPASGAEGATPGSGTWDLQNFTDIRHGNSGRFGFGEEVNHGFQNNPILATGGSKALAIFAESGNTSDSQAFDVSTRAGGVDTTRHLQTAGAYSTSFDFRLNPNWLNNDIAHGGGGNNAHCIWFNTQIADAAGSELSEGSMVISHDSASGWTLAAGQNYSFTDSVGLWYKLEVIHSVVADNAAPGAPDADSAPDILFTTKLWSPDLTTLYATLYARGTFQGAGADVDGSLAYGNRSENWIFTGNNIIFAPTTVVGDSTFYNNFYLIDNYVEGAPLEQVALPEPATISVAIMALGGCALRRSRPHAAT